MENCCNSCTNEPVKLIYSCSGCADVGEMADKISRKLSASNIGKMTCLAGIGAGLSSFIASAENASQNIAIDGCNVQCAKKTLEKTNVNPQSITLTDLGLSKGRTIVNSETINKTYEKVVEEINKKL